MVVASFTEPAQQHRAPFPLIPTGVHIATMLAAAYPHFDIVDEKFVFRTSPETFADSLRYTTLGCVLLAAGHYACQFVAALRPLRHEYLGTMALLQLLYVGLLAGRAVLHPAAARADWAGSAVGALAALLSLVLTLYDKYDPRICPVAEAASEEELRDRLPSGSDAATLAAARSLAVRHAAARNAVRVTAAWLVPAATHALWLLYAVNLNMSYLAPYITASPSSYGAAVQSALSYCSAVPYREYVVLLVDGLAVLRLAAAVSGGGKKEAAEAKAAKAGEAKSD